MQLVKAEICNFRSIKNFTFDFSRSYTALVGINESGKSNILKALSLLDDKIPFGRNDVRDPTPDEPPITEAFVKFTIKLDEEDLKQSEESVFEYFSGNPKTPILRISGKDLTISHLIREYSNIILTVDLIKDHRVISRQTLPEDARTLEPWKKIKTTTVEAGKKSSYIEYSDSTADPDSSEEYLPLLPVEIVSTIRSGLQEGLHNRLPKVIFWKYNQNQLLPGAINYQQFKEDPDYCIPLKHMFHLAQISEIKEALENAEGKKNGKRNLLNRVSEATTKHLHRVWKEYRGIEFELAENGENIEAYIIDKFNTFDLSRRSDGFKRFITFLLHVSAKAKANNLSGCLYLEDEPDTGLHPSGARYLRDELIKLSKDNIVVYATHSIFMIDGNHIDRHLIISKKDETTVIERASEANFCSEEVIFNALGHSIFEHLQKNNVIFEGYRDKHLFNIALNSQKISNSTKSNLTSIGHCFAQGVKDIPRITALLELARRNYLIISDGDATAREHQKQSPLKEKWIRYDQLLENSDHTTSEDFINTDHIQKTCHTIANKRQIKINYPLELSSSKHIQAITRWLTQNSVNPTLIKEILNEIKDELFLNLKPTHVNENYFTLLNSLANRLESMSTANHP